MLGVAGYWISELGQRIATLLGLRQMHGSHSGNHQGNRVVWEVIEENGLEDRVGFRTLDQASNNDTALFQNQRRMEEIGNQFPVEERRLLCFGHVINLSVQALLWGENAASFAREEEANYQSNTLDSAQEVAAMWE